MTEWMILGSDAVSGAFYAVAGLYLIYRLLHTKRPAVGALLAAAAGTGVIAAAAGASELPMGGLAAEIIWQNFRGVPISAARIWAPFWEICWIMRLRLQRRFVRRKTGVFRLRSAVSTRCWSLRRKTAMP